MAVRIPLVIVGGQIEQLQSGDSITVPQSNYVVVSQTNGEAGPIVIGTPVYSSAVDTVKKGKANAGGTSTLLGLVKDVSISSSSSGLIIVSGVLSASTAQWDAVFQTTGGLTFGTKYWLDPATAGFGTSTAPSTVGQYVVYLGLAISTTELFLGNPFDEVLL